LEQVTQYAHALLEEFTEAFNHAAAVAAR